MFAFRMFCFLVVLCVVFHPIRGETKRNQTELKVNSTQKIINEGKGVSEEKGISKEKAASESKGASEVKEVSETKETSEGVLEETVSSPSSGIVFSEGGAQKTTVNKTAVTESTNESAIVKPVSEKTSIEKQGGEGEVENTQAKIENSTEINATNAHVTVPKKGVSLNDASKTSGNVTSTTADKSTTVYVKPKKPIVTVGSHDESQTDQKGKNSSTEKVPSIEYYEKNKQQIKKADFVIPIVAVILSVPIVAIVLNILYKRGKEWWSHRHYRRMDFLIDGMYNN